MVRFPHHTSPLPYEFTSPNLNHVDQAIVCLNLIFVMVSLLHLIVSFPQPLQETVTHIYVVRAFKKLMQPSWGKIQRDTITGWTIAWVACSGSSRNNH